MTQSPDPFEFFSGGGGGGGEICLADDIIHDGKLLPSSIKTRSFDYRRCESDGGKFISGGGGKLTAGDNRKLKRAASEPMGPQRAPALPASKASRVRPRWYWLAFRSVRAPAEMVIDDIKIRQRRRRGSTAVMEVAEAANGVCGIEGGKGVWRVIRSLSCKGSESAVDVNVTAPLREVRCFGSL